MNIQIMENDKVCMKYDHSWVGEVVVVDASVGIGVIRPGRVVVDWIYPEYLELAPGNEAELIA